MILSVMESFSNTDLMIFVVIIFLIVISMMMFYLVYSQNKQLTRELYLRDQKEKEKEKEVVLEVPVEESNAELFDLQKVTKELEALPKEKTVNLTSYEEEQEEKAIISYDELLEASKKVSINYSDTDMEDDITVRKVDLDNTGKIELDPIKKELNSRVSLVSYEHEEAFLKALKQLQSLLN